MMSSDFHSLVCAIRTTISPSFDYLVGFYYYYIYLCISCSESLWLRRLCSSCGRRGYSSHCSVWASNCSHLSCCAVWALGVRASAVAAHGVSSCVQAQSTDSIVVVHGLSCSPAWDLPGSELNLCLLHRQAGSFPLSHPGKTWLVEFYLL